MNQIKYIAIDNLSALPRNPRTISADAFRKLCESIKDNPEYFEARPIICSNRTGKNVVIAGNMRLRAAKKLAMKEVPVVILSIKSEKKEKEIILRDNINNGQWDFEIIGNDFEPELLEVVGFEVPGLKSDDKSEGEKKGEIYYSLFQVVIDCDGESEQQQIFEKLSGEGIRCRVLTL